MWVDLYNYAALAETIGVGVWACRETSPGWTVDGLRDAFMGVAVGEAGAELREKARILGEEVRAREPGRDVAAKEIAKLAYH